ncbi:hypothetical protein ACCO45_012119 [Purpureocillium lilacinum]|uniref:Uncharacterized protein n=1 Tax=Purpureocillium lilacinum TaxID=33203 RepID=A0ACC4DDH8_PURLI
MERKPAAFITGGASGLGRAVATHLSREGVNVFIADRDGMGADTTARECGGRYAVVDVTVWESQVAAFQRAVDLLGRIDYVFPFAGIGENDWSPSKDDSGEPQDFKKPNLSVVDINLTGVLYTVSIAVQHFRRQQLDCNGFRGKGERVQRDSLA